MRISYFLFALVLFTSPTLMAETTRLKIGVVASLSGAAELPGKAWLEGAELAAKELSDEGIPLDLVVEDDHSNPTQAVSAFNKLVTSDKVTTVLGGTWDFLAAAVYPVALRQKTPFITVSNPIELVADQTKDNPYAFTNSISLASESKVVDQFLEKKAIGKAALVYIDVPYGEMHRTMVEKILAKHHIPIAYSQSVAFDGMVDGIRRAALGCAQKKVDFVFLVFDGEGTDLFLREAERLHEHLTVLATQGLDKGYTLSGHAARYHDIFGIYPPPGSAEFQKRFRAHFGHEPHDFAAGAYDAVQFVAHAEQAAVNLAAPQKPFSWDGITGVHFVPAENHEIAHQKAVLMTIRDGKFTEE